jgi:hypothetical protein
LHPKFPPFGDGDIGDDYLVIFLISPLQVITDDSNAFAPQFNLNAVAFPNSVIAALLPLAHRSSPQQRRRGEFCDALALLGKVLWVAGKFVAYW